MFESSKRIDESREITHFDKSTSGTVKKFNDVLGVNIGNGLAFAILEEAHTMTDADFDLTIPIKGN